MKKLSIPAAVLLLTVIALTAGGCSPQERSGVSSLPQNRPASWETNPYGNLGM
ncbi:MAG: hypothetical protein PHI85_10300 [Victivallaceae bacterium]|nr:hypothetical protein [Victivallaceae bacterium]